MKKLMRRNREQSLFRARRNRRPIYMLHSSATHVVSDMKNKSVTIKRRAAHEREFVLTNLRKFGFKILPLLNFPVNPDANLRRNAFQLERLKITFPRIGDLKRRICKSVVSRRLEHVNDDLAGL